ncbi:CoA transferase [Primorskyibacter sp. S87]|uniref:CoA transferase n=1 Tax=Primorskyibacter sp. S87 TaxID=3415126 RepID=UPI003C7E9274
MQAFSTDITTAFGTGFVEETGHGSWQSCFAVSDLAVQSMGAVGSALAALIEACGAGSAPAVTIDRRLASLWFSQSIHPQGWRLPPLWDAVAGDYEGKDGWIRLHTNARHHLTAALSVLGCSADRDRVVAIVREWEIELLEREIVAAGGAAAAMRSRSEWLKHPQGAAVASEPLVHWEKRSGSMRDWAPVVGQPLSGLRVLDLTRVIAGPVATRTLAGFGADVLRVDPKDWSEPGVVPDVNLGKRCCRLNLKTSEGLEIFESLLEKADVLVHGYRPGALDRLISRSRRASLSPGMIEVCHDAYGWNGPMAGRRGFDSLVQMSSGIAEAGRRWSGSERPHPLPVQALDHATGYFVATAVLVGLARAVRGEGIFSARLSLARTAETLAAMPAIEDDQITGSDKDDLDDWQEKTPWGPALRLRPAIRIDGNPMKWDRPAADLGSAPPAWT